MQSWLNAIRGQASLIAGESAQLRCAIVQSFDPATYCAKVTLQPEGVLTGWLPISTSWIGGGWGMVAPPSPGQQVIVLAQEGQAEHGIVLGGLFSTNAQPPAAPAGELWLVHQSGSYLKLHNDGSIEGAAALFSFTGNVEIFGNLLVSGDISDKSGSHGNLDAFRAVYDQHIHPGVQSGPNNTALPIPQVQ
jgi:phage baseplate assembly protein gpV